ncbi:MAG TPA: autotransporter-associated beta strand repeat-containing protein [Chthoniobacterales bacterium]|jgi:autotransporter-associated beta strand protein
MKSCTLAALLSILFSQAGIGGSAQWSATPTSSDWNTAANWVPNTVPNGPDDIATFGRSRTTVVTVSSDVQVSEIVFSRRASAYSIAPANDTTNLTVSGGGVINNSTIEQNLGGVVGPSSESYLIFDGSSTSGVLTTITQSFSFTETSSASTSSFVLGDAFNPSLFGDSATAANATFDVSNNGIIFSNTSTAAEAIFTLHGTTGDLLGGVAQFQDTATAGSAIFNIEGATSAGANGRGGVLFETSSTAESASIAAKGGTNGGAGGYVTFSDSSSGGRASITVLGNATLDNVGHHTVPPLAIGSLAGSGIVLIGKNSLKVGTNSHDAVFSGTIQDSGGGGGGITKVGSGAWTLGGANSYLGGTFVSDGTLLVTNTTGSATGPGPVQVGSGTLGGSGIIGSALVLGDSQPSNGVVAPSAGGNAPTHLTVLGTLTFQFDGTYVCQIDPKQRSADMITANGVLISPGALFNLNSPTNVRLHTGSAFTIIDNTAATAISGTFSNLADGASIRLGKNTYLASYEGGDGNDLVLTAQ